MKNPIKYDTGYKRLDNFLSAVAYGITIASLLCLASIASLVLWAHWKLYA